MSTLKGFFSRSFNDWECLIRSIFFCARVRLGNGFLLTVGKGIFFLFVLSFFFFVFAQARNVRVNYAVNNCRGQHGKERDKIQRRKKTEWPINKEELEGDLLLHLWRRLGVGQLQ